MATLKTASLILIVLIPIANIYCQKDVKGTLSLETDPITSVLGARTIWGIYTPKSTRHYAFGLNLFTSDFSNRVDDFINPKNKNKGFETKVKLGGGISIDYFLKDDNRGYYFGIINLLFNNEVSLNTETKRFLSHNIIPRAGYRWYPFPKLSLYINPFFGFRFEYTFETVRFQSSEVAYKAAGLRPFGSFHLGYAF